MQFQLAKDRKTVMSEPGLKYQAALIIEEAPVLMTTNDTDIEKKICQEVWVEYQKWLNRKPEPFDRLKKMKEEKEAALKKKIAFDEEKSWDKVSRQYHQWLERLEGFDFDQRLKEKRELAEEKKKSKLVEEKRGGR